MGTITFITGGARSGKSRFAESLLSGKDDVLYLATAIGFDDEMRDRIAKHRSRRNPGWETVECHRGFAGELITRLAGRRYILLDCVTIMINNIMVVDSDVDWNRAGMDAVDRVEQHIQREIFDFIVIARNFTGETLIVSNEIGLGLVPPTPLGRYYRDIAGKVNQLIAAESDYVYLMVSGIPVKIK
ncbi:MAG: bifunctional adenosylcobinamide kinase/adenosylcobinamide-phosphate guanylyltransferase [Spirochaetes bacterium RBG_13_51_14]|nr:MAG: bifunctional adenosylcobinamide kinase/adenosylcobinamide-phosphate guanylyltransferase [Spirochaetes bacterium RBG_13_51_14]